MSLRLKAHVTSLFKEYSPGIKLNIVFSSKYRLSTMFSYKDKIPFDLQSYIVYNFQCSRCNSRYIGKTYRHLKVRACEHLALSYRTEKHTSPNTTIATNVTHHCHGDQKHQNDYSAFKVLSQAPNNFHLKLKESLLILKYNPDLNIASESIPLYLFS